MLLGEPANKETSPLGVIFRIQLLPWSATKTLPLTSTATPTGFRKRAALPLALVVPDTPVAEPANKLTLMPSSGPFIVRLLPAQIVVGPAAVMVGVLGVGLIETTVAALVAEVQTPDIVCKV